MIVYALLTIATVFVSLFVDNKANKISYGFSRQQVLNYLGIFTIFSALFVVSALRLNVGNDYAKYVEYFHLIRCKLDTETVVPTEPGFNLVCIFIYLLCGRKEYYLLMFAFFAFVTVFLFIRAIYEEADSFPFTFFMFMTLGYYFQSLNTIRYYFALAIAVCAIPYVLRKEWLRFILLIVFAAFFHKSVLLVIPLYFLAAWSWKIYQIVIILLLGASCFFFQDEYLRLFLKFYPTYDGTQYLSGGTSYFAILRCVLILIISLFLYKKVIQNDRRMSFFFYCNLGAILVYVCLSFLPSISRVGYYLSITHIFFLPALINAIEKEKIKKLMTILTVLACIAYFVIFLLYEAPSNGLRILPYETWLFHDMVNILSDVS